MARFTTNQLLAVITGLGLGLAIWTGSQFASGKVEAWDAPGYYFPTLIGVSIFGGFMFPRADGLFLASLLVGQVIGLFLVADPGPLMIIAIFPFALFSVPAILGVLAGALASRWMTKRQP